eukprot:m.102546 g.102546  ORF g.102546 m.102546 type:complete len:183 (-) comp18782_c0_seq1:179-727(-)
MKEYKLVVLGSGGVGKSALTVRFVKGNFVEKYDPLIEDSYRKQLNAGGAQYLLEITEVNSSNENNRDQLIRESQGCVLVYSIVDQNSLNAAVMLRERVFRVKETTEVPVMLVGNKCDLEDSRVVTKKKGKDSAGSARFLEVSAKKNTNVDLMFQQLVDEIVKRERPSRNVNKAFHKGVCVLS